ncbi:MAG: MMPL family transporter, partial [Pirellulales bacterium]
MFPDDDPLLPPFRKLKRVFGAGDVVLAAYDDPELMTRAGIARVEQVASDLKKVAGVKAVFGLHSVSLGGKVLTADLRKLLEGFTHGADGSTAALVCFLRPDADAAETVTELRRVIEGQTSGSLAGETVMIHEGFRYLEEDGRRLGWISTLLLAATIIYCFRSIRWVVVPIAVVQLTLLLTRATLAWSGFRLSMVSSMLTAIITVVAVAAVMRVIVGFRNGREAGNSPRAALQAALYALLVPTIWSCLTDALGFGSLLVAEVGPVRDFGLMTALGALWAIAALVLVLPGIALIGRV